MNEPFVRQIDPQSGDDELSSREELARFKQLVLSDEHHALTSLQVDLQRLRQETEQMVDNLPQVLAESHKGSSAQLSNALVEPMIGAVKIIANQDVKKLSAALFPVMGPAIRQYVADMLKGLTDQLNETVRSATSFKQIKWRIEAKLAGKPFSEYVLLKTLNYRIQYVLMVDPNSGLLLQQVSRDGDANENPELVSGMLVAIRSFVKDSFAKGGEGELGRFSFGEHEIYLESGPNAILAAVGTGTPPPVYRKQMSEALERVHLKAGNRLELFNGDQNTIAFARPYLEALLTENKGDTVSAGANPWPFRILASVVLLSISAVLLFFAFENWRWKGAIDALKIEPGIEVYQNEKGFWNKRKLGVLQDPVARSAASIIEESGINLDRAELTVSHFFSPDEALAEKRLIASKQEDGHRVALPVSTAKNGSHSPDLRRELAKYGEQVAQLNQEVVALRQKITELEAASAGTGEDMESLLVSNFYSRFPYRDAVHVDFGEKEKTWKISGTISEPHYSRILSEAKNLFPRENLVDTSGLVDSSSQKITALLKDIETMRIHYQSGSEKMTKDGHKARQSAYDALKRLDELYRHSGRFPLPMIEVFATAKAAQGNIASSSIVRKRLINESNALQAVGISEARIRPSIEETSDPSKLDTIYIRVSD